jgi:hypothetical protein
VKIVDITIHSGIVLFFIVMAFAESPLWLVLALFWGAMAFVSIHDAYFKRRGNG